jgi:hypothetical protein
MALVTLFYTGASANTKEAANFIAIAATFCAEIE